MRADAAHEMVASATMSDAADIRLRLANRSENVSIVREMLAGVGEALTLPSGALDEIRTAVSEACNNVVIHAYDGAEGPMEVEVTAMPRRLVIVVRDQGTGIQPHLSFDEESMHGVGLAVIQAFTDSVELRGAADQGTEVRMEFAVPDPPGRVVSVAVGRAASRAEVALPPGEAVVSLAPGPLLGPVLAHVSAALAVRAHFSVDRLSDAQLLADAVAAHAPAASATGGEVHVGFSTDSRLLELRVGPLRPGAGRNLTSDSGVAGLEPVIARLTDEVAIEPVDSGEVVTVRMRDPR